MKGIKEIKENHYKSLQLQTTNTTTSAFPIIFLPNSSHTLAKQSYNFNLSSKYIWHEWSSLYMYFEHFLPLQQLFVLKDTL